MTDAAAPLPARRSPGQTASQLSENIGDVLASIRRLIAQDQDDAPATMAEGPPSPGLRPGGEAPRPDRVVPAPRRGRSEATAALRRDVLAQAQALNRRSEAAFGQPPAVTGAGAAPSPDAAAFRSPATLTGPAQTGGAADMGRLVLRTPVAAGAGVVRIGPPATAAGPGPADADAQGPDAGLSAVQQSSAESHAGGFADEHGSASPSAATHAPAVPAPRSAWEPGGAAVAQHIVPAAERPAEPSRTNAIDLGPVPAAPPAHSMPAASMPPVAPSAAAVAGAGTPPGTDDDAGSAIFGAMIREVVRSELHQSGMSRDLRAMILREVAQVLTGGGRGR